MINNMITGDVVTHQARALCAMVLTYSYRDVLVWATNAKSEIMYLSHHLKQISLTAIS